MRLYELIEPRSPLTTPAFRAWFGDSKVVDAHGNPLRVYHGTMDNFDTFARGQGTSYGGNGAREGKLGFWFTDNPQVASDFAEWSSRGYDPAIVMAVYLKIQHPWIVKHYAEIRELVDRHTKFNQPPLRMMQDKVDHVSARQELINHGYDGIILPNTLTDSPDEQTLITQYVALYSNQIKSATGNQGRFDDANPSITETT
jgi:hypothetical protein